MAKPVPYRYRVLVLLCSLTTLTYLDRICISLVGVRIKSDLGLSNEQFGWALASFALAYALFEIPSGILGDRIGPRAVFLRIVIGWSLFTMLTGVATGILSLVIIRFLFGVGESGTYPNSLIVISRWFPVRETGRSLLWLGMGSQIGSAIAPLIIIPLAVSFGWRVPFYVNGVIGILWVLACFLWFRNFPSEMKNISAGELQLIEASRRYNRDQHLISLKYILNNRNLWALMLLYFCCQAMNYFFVAWMPLYLQEGRHFSENQMKTITSTLFIAGIAGFLGGGYAGDFFVRRMGLRVGRRMVGMLGMGVCAALVLLAGLLNRNSWSAGCLVAANGFFSFGIMVCYAVCADIGRNNAGTVTGAMNFSGQMGAFCLAIFFGKMADATHNFNYPILVLSFTLIAGTLLWLLIDPSKQLNLPR